MKQKALVQTRMFKTLSTVILICFFNYSGFSQELKGPYKLGSVQSFVKTKIEYQEAIIINVSNDESFTIDIESSISSIHKYYLFGSVRGYKNATFYILGNDQNIEGKLLDYENKKAFVINTDDKKQVFIKEVDINREVCVMDGWLTNEKPVKVNTSKQKKTRVNIPELESMPGAVGVLYIDFDGENVSGGPWGTVNGQATDYTEEQIEKAWYIMAEDFTPYNINVTTIRSVYDGASTNSRQMVIFNETFPPQGGVAQFSTFNTGNVPCWVNTTGIIDSVWLAANVGSHESGHTLGLMHDGDATNQYWLGHGDYNVIMGRCDRTIVQWNQGEYQGANNTEDDISIIEANNNVGFRADDHGNDTASSSGLSFNSSSGEVMEDDNFGIIETRTDKDYFEFTATAGTIDLNFRPADRFLQSPNLDIQVRLLDASGNEIAVSSPGVMTATINETVPAGIYYIEIDGVGFGDPLTNGYSDYGSLGQYFISGSIPVDILSIYDDSLVSTKIYPNPSSGQLTIDFDTSRIQQLEIELIDVLGKQVYSTTLTPTNKTLNLDHLQKGMYFVLLSEGERSIVKKIVIK